MKICIQILIFIAFKAYAVSDPQISSWSTVDASHNGNGGYESK